MSVTVGFWVLLAILAHAYLAPYSTVAGQLALGVIVTGFGFTLAWLQRLTRPVVGARLLADLDEPPGTPTRGRVSR